MTLHRSSFSACLLFGAIFSHLQTFPFVFVLDLSKRFKQHPQSTNIGLLSLVQLQCNPPGGNPPPIVAWRKNGVDIRTDARVQTENVFGSYHYLRITEALQKDTGNYTCVAKNKVGERVSRPAFLRILGKVSLLHRIALSERTPDGFVRSLKSLFKYSEEKEFS